jgi:predicted ATPase
MLIAVTGSQGCGKTTVINELKARGYNIIERKTSRSILSEWGVTLYDVNNDHDLTIKFQDEIVKRKAADEKEARDSDSIWFTERSYADLFVYALIDLGRDSLHSEWIEKYYNTCMRLQQSYDMVYYLKAGHFSIQHDGVRGSDPFYSRMVDTIMYDFTQQMTTPSALSVIDTPSIQQRVSTIATQATGTLQRIQNTEFRNDGK